MELTIREIELPLRHVFRISYGETVVQKNLLVELRAAGISGYGESTPLRYHGVTIESTRRSLEAARSRIEAETLDDPAALWQRLLPVLGHDRSALCGVDEAAHDLWGKQRGAPVYRLWGLDLSHAPPSDYSIGIDSVPTMVEKMREFADWPIYKIKLGTPHDLAIVRQLREHTTAAFRVDANTAWSVDETIANARELRTLGVEFIEQPLAADDWEGMRRVFAESALPLIADESCQREEDVDRCHGFFHGVNIKLAKCGGMTPARRMIDRARRLGLQVMLGCMSESTVGISAGAQLLPLLDYADLDGAVLLARDVASGPSLRKGRMTFPAENGNGVRLLT